MTRAINEEMKMARVVEKEKALLLFMLSLGMLAIISFKSFNAFVNKYF